jgi:hypothetical protein
MPLNCRQPSEGKGGTIATSRVALIVAFIASLLVSCSLFSTALRFEPVALAVEERRNGFLVELLTDTAIADGAGTMIARPHWLIVTVPDTLLDTTGVATFRSPIVDSTEVHRFETVTQFSLRFTKAISSAEILRSRNNKGLAISVFF